MSGLAHDYPEFFDNLEPEDLADALLELLGADEVDKEDE